MGRPQAVSKTRGGKYISKTNFNFTPKQAELLKRRRCNFKRPPANASGRKHHKMHSQQPGNFEKQKRERTTKSPPCTPVTPTYEVGKNPGSTRCPGRKCRDRNKGGLPPKSIGLYDGLSDPPRQGGRRDRQALCGPDTDTKEGQISKTEP